MTVATLVASDLRPLERLVLVSLVLHPRLGEEGVTAIARHTGLSGPGTSRIVSRLQRRGWLRRERRARAGQIGRAPDRVVVVA